MMYLVLFVISGLVLAVGTRYLAIKARNKFGIEKGLFLKIGLIPIIIALFHAAVLDGALSYWPDFGSQNILIKGFTLGLFGALFYELGRFFVLDKIFKVRSKTQAIYFGLAWSGVTAFILGIASLIGAYAIWVMLSPGETSQIFAGADSSQLEVLSQFRDFIINEANNTPLMGLAPLFQRGALLILDVLLTMVVVFGLIIGSSAYVWYAIMAHTIFIGGYYVCDSIHPYLGLTFLVFAAGVSFYAAKRFKHLLPE